MSIASRIEQIEQHLTDDYSVLELAGADLTNVDKNIQNLKQSWEERLLYFLANGTDVVWNNWLPKVTGTGETITLNNTIEAKMDFVYKGNTSQKTTTGKNLFNSIYYKNKEIYTETISISTGNLYCTKLYLKPNTTYTISEALNNWSLDGGWIFVVADTNNQIIRFLQNRTQDYQTNPTTFTTNSEGYVYIGHRYGFTNGGADRAIAFLNTVNIQIEEGNTATSFEEYTNGASPNPDYPQDIHVVSGDNTIKVENGDNTQSVSYPINLGNIELCKIGDYQDSIKKSTGKNLFDKDNVVGGFVNADGSVGGDTNAYRTSNFIPIQPNTAYYKTSTESPRTKYYDSNKQPLNTTTYQDILIGGNAGTFTTPNNAYYLRFSYPVSSVNANSIMINEGTTALPYEPYGKVWYLNKEIGKVVLDGSENWSTEPAYSSDYTRYVGTIFDEVLVNNRGMNNYFTQRINQAHGDYQYLYIQPNARNVHIQIYSSIVSSLNDFKTWLSTNNTIVYYVLTTSTSTEITDSTLISQLEAIKKSYNNQTNISQENSKEAFILDVTALGN